MKDTYLCSFLIFTVYIIMIMERSFNIYITQKGVDSDVGKYLFVICLYLASAIYDIV